MQGEEWLLSGRSVRAVLADKFLGDLATEDGVEVLLMLSPFDALFDSIEEQVQILINIFLLVGLRHTSVDLFVRKEEVLSFDGVSLTVKEVAKQDLALMQKVIRCVSWVKWPVFTFKNEFTEVRTHKQLLLEWVHVASAAKID